MNVFDVSKPNAKVLCESDFDEVVRRLRDRWKTNPAMKPELDMYCVQCPACLTFNRGEKPRGMQGEITCQCGQKLLVGVQIVEKEDNNL